MSDAHQPEDLPRLFLQALNAGDVEGVVSRYEPTGVIAMDDHQVVSGHEAIRTMVADFLAHRPRFTLEQSDVVRSGDLAVIRSSWTIATADPEGKQMDLHVAPTLVARQQADGAWLVSIDRPTTRLAPGASSIPTLPATDLSVTRDFFKRLGFVVRYWSPLAQRAYLIMGREDLEMHFFGHSEIRARENYAGCYWRVKNADTLRIEFSDLGLPASGAPSMTPIENKAWGMREFAIVDPAGNLIRIGHSL